MLYYFDFSTWWKLVRLAARESNPHQRRGLLRLLLWQVPLRTVLHSICFALDGILFPLLWRTKIKTPVFVLGHARSGTTLAHRLMCGDERFSAFKYYELLLPSLLEKKLVRIGAWLDRKILGQRLERRLLAWEQRKFGPTQHIHKMGLNIPEEDDLIFQNACASGFWMTKLPYLNELDFFHIDQRPASSRRRMYRFYRECVRRQLYLNGPDHIHLSKNPAWCGRLETLLEVFPDARFVLLYRNPFETIPSLLKLLHVSWRLQGNMSQQRIAESTKVMTEISFETYLYPLEVLQRHPDTPRTIVDYQDLIQKPRATIEKVYADLGLEITPAFRDFLTAEEAKAKRHSTEHRYSLAEFGLDDKEIENQLAPLFDRFKWASATESIPAEKETRHA